jgi:predicted DsbA family dithiol-disulfide isomerase
MSTPTVDVHIWSDVMCPWCAIGYAQYEKALAELEGEIDVETRWMPFELNPDMPPEGKTQAQHLAETYNRSEEELTAMRKRLSEVAERVGFSIQFEGPAGEPGMMWNTFDAHKLLRWALALQGPEAQTRLSLALFRAHFQERRSIASREVLLGIAEEQGFDRGAAAEAIDEEALGIAVRAEENRGLEAGINSVPSFVVNGKYLIPGAQEPEVFVETIRRVAAMAEGDVRNA